MSLSIERSFEVPVPVERAWRAMTDPAELNRWYFPLEIGSDGSVRTEIQGGPRETEVPAAEPLRYFHTRTRMSGREGFAVVPGSREMRVSFEPRDDGTRITIVHSGWPVPGGLEICEVEPGSFACRVGLQAGDLLLELDGAGVFGHAEIGFFMKLRDAGEKVEARWLRGADVLRGIAELGPAPRAR